MKNSILKIGITTVPLNFDFKTFSKRLLKKKLVVCIQIDTTVQSFFIWKSKFEKEKEKRIWIKFHKIKEKPLMKEIHKIHPHEVPLWIVLKPDQIGKLYHNWMGNY
jgi:uncharacterized protein involved in tolerance to divalent cations